MLCVNSYPQDYINGCRSRMEGQLAAYRSLTTDADPAAVAAFEPQFFNHLVQVLDHSFVHRARARELKDGNALNEVRMLCASLLENGGVLAADKSIKYRPEKSVLGLEIGQEIRLTAADFERLCSAFFTEIEAKFRA